MGLKALLAAAALVAAVAIAVALLAGRGGGPRVQGIQAETTLGPTAALFGDRLGAEVRVVLDRRTVDPDSVVVSVDFGALSAPALTAPLRERAGDVVVLRYRYGLFCLRDECRATGGLRRLRVAPAVIRYKLRDGTRRTGRLEWPDVTVGTRLGGQPAGIADWRIRDELPAPTYRLSPSTVAAVGFSLALVVDELAGLPPLERALRMLRLALANGSPPEHRRALDRLARELRREGHRDLAGEARKLAWQRPGPDRDDADVLAGRVATAIGAPA
jgi:hypothetical protein